MKDWLLRKLGAVPWFNRQLLKIVAGITTLITGFLIGKLTALHQSGVLTDEQLQQAIVGAGGLATLFAVAFTVLGEMAISWITHTLGQKPRKPEILQDP
jgi:hypothetical protein